LAAASRRNGLLIAAASNSLAANSSFACAHPWRLLRAQLMLTPRKGTV